MLSEISSSIVPLTPSDVKEKFGISQTSISSVITRLEKSKHIRRKSSETDRRSFYLIPTKQGVDKVENIEKKVIYDLQLALKDLYYRKVAALVEIFDRYTQGKRFENPQKISRLNIKRITSLNDLAAARGFLVRKFVERGIESQLPETILASKNFNYILLKDEKISGVVEISKNSEGVCDIRLSTLSSNLSKSKINEFLEISKKMC